MNITREISSNHQANSSHYTFPNGTGIKADIETFSLVYITNILLSLPPNSYVMWLIMTGTRNRLAAEFFILNFSVCEILICLDTLAVLFTHKYNISWIFVAVLDGVLVVGHPLFQSLICVERYLAVVHPVIFLKFKPLRYRLMCSAVIWTVTVVFSGLNAIIFSFVSKLYFLYFVLPFIICLSIQMFCCLAVLRVLKKSGPGERGREEENHMKKRAFQLILISTLSMLMGSFPYIVLIALITPKNVNLFMCAGQSCFTLAGLVQPALFLYRIGKR